MEGPIKHGTVPLRPVPVYGQRSPTAPDYLPTMRESRFDVKKTYDSLTLAKHLEMIAFINHSRPASDFCPGQRLPLHTGPYNYLYSGLKTFSEVHSNALSSSFQNQNHSNQCDKETTEQYQNSSLDLSKPKFHDGTLNSVICANPENTLSVKSDKCEKPAFLEKAYEQNGFLANRSHVDRLTVPVLVSCANSLTSQYGYGRKVFPCPQCRYTTDRRNNLKRHMLTMHQTCSKTLECCGILFATKASLREHAMIFHYHGYTCYYCGRRFCRKALLKRHLSVHNGQKDFVCSVCDYATSHKSNLERHRKVHCRSDEERLDKMDCETDHMTIPACVWGSEGHRDIYSVSGFGNNDIVSSSSDDENVEINVVSD